jgi:transglutaminase-like putative cysteine protease
MKDRVAKPGRAALAAQGAVLAAAALVFLWSLATPAGLAAVALSVLGATWFASRLEGLSLRLAGWLGLSGAALVGAWLGARTLLAQVTLFEPALTLWVADALLAGTTAFVFTLLVRLLSARWRAASVLELAFVAGAIASFFAAHRHQRIHQPRFLSDWAWAHGLEPEAVLAVLGIVAAAFAALLLLRTGRTSRLLAMLALLLVGGGLLLLLGGAPSLAVAKPDDLGMNGEGEGNGKSDSDKKNDDKNQGGGSGGAPPQPIAVAVLHDELPEADVLYFRQAVRSKLVGDRLVEDPSGQFDVDLATRFPAGAPVRVTTPQADGVHRALHTSMFLLADHAQLPGLAFPREFTPIPNPNPGRFVTAYDVDSQLLTRPIERLLGRRGLDPAWSDETVRHYTEVPTDPRYRELSDELVRDVDPRFVGDDVVKALTIKEWLEEKGFYSLQQKQLVGDDPVAQFLFGDLRGYCVHFAHAAVYLFRSQGLAARVAIGYAVETQQRGAGSAILIFANEAHAWPEVFLEGVGWVTLDIFPRQSDEPPPQRMERDLEAAMGELARKEPPGLTKDRVPWHVPWPLVGLGALVLLGAALVAAFTVKLYRRLATRTHREQYRAVLDRLSDRGLARQFGETRERHAARTAALAPSFVPLTAAHLRLALRGDDPAQAQAVAELARATVAELRRNTPRGRRALAFLNPIGWWFTR